ncbi:DUF2017 domain-containing protein [Actinopolyspora mortivallis]|uniref:DUF2017 domain-containing protein n=1 Tax=Actinopolyspora mortivallis TaxID=33906 RepID=UPI000370A573|nr:DUF2017 domain-containing protein [Actinopolyspora mortivallis]
MQDWTRDNGRLVSELEPNEAAVIRGLVGEIRDMLAGRAQQAPQDELAELTGMRTGPSTPPEEGVLARLLPDFIRSDRDTFEPETGEADTAGALRSLHEPELIDHKSGVATTVLETCPERGGTVSLTEDQADSWLTAINDVRLALGTALGISEDFPDEPPRDELQREHYYVYQWLTWVQDSMIQALTS